MRGQASATLSLSSFPSLLFLFREFDSCYEILARYFALKMRLSTLAKHIGMHHQKQEVRASIRAKLRNLSEASQQTGAGKTRTLLEGQNIWWNSRKILFYAPMPYELDIWPLLEDAIRFGKEAYLPRFQGASYIASRVTNIHTDLTSGQFGIREPIPGSPEIPLNRLDFVLVPGIAFDLQGRRLGRGKGYYDRLLAEVRGTTCGVAFDEQIVEELPVEPHDIHLNCILTPTRWIEFPGHRAVLK
jgi:5-formyltetrahydrofolate cyclo-ligase